MDEQDPQCVRNEKEVELDGPYHLVPSVNKKDPQYVQNEEVELDDPYHLLPSVDEQKAQVEEGKEPVLQSLQR